MVKLGRPVTPVRDSVLQLRSSVFGEHRSFVFAKRGGTMQEAQR
jgi:hypothetical protein